MAFTGWASLFAALLALPLSQTSWQSPEIAAVLAVAAVAVLAGHRWALAIIALAELCLLPSMLPRLGPSSADEVRLAAGGCALAMAPGLLGVRHAFGAFTDIVHWRRSAVAVVAVLLIAALALPL